MQKSRDKKELALREACNKVMHAKGLELTPKQEMPDGKQFVGRKITLWGDHYDRRWEAVLDVVKFCDALAFLPRA
jgi:hypothetical protein